MMVLMMESNGDKKDRQEGRKVGKKGGKCEIEKVGR